MTPSDFALWFLSHLENVPSCTVEVSPRLDVDDDDYGDTVSTPSTGKHRLFFRSDIFQSLDLCVAIIAHEATHAAMFDTINALTTAGVISEDVGELIEHRCACIAEEIARRCVEYRKEIETYYNGLEEDH